MILYYSIKNSKLALNGTKIKLTNDNQKYNPVGFGNNMLFEVGGKKFKKYTQCIFFCRYTYMHLDYKPLRNGLRIAVFLLV